MADESGASVPQEPPAPMGEPPVAPRLVTCPICGAAADVSGGSRCMVCSTDLAHPAIALLADADEAIAQCQSSYDQLAARWGRWNAQRASLVAQLESTRLSPSTAAQYARPAAGVATPDSGSAPLAAPRPTQRTAASAPSSTQARPPQPPTPPRPARRTPRRLTGPVLLGIAGASLLIAAAIIFVAVTWTTFNPGAQGLLILAVATAVGYGAIWLGRHDLAVSGGAVGVVSASFAGLAVFAFDRGAGVLSSFTTAGALVVTGAAGLLLSRWGVRWVQSFAALSVVAAGVAVPVAFDWHVPPFEQNWFASVCTLSALGVAATYPLWRASLARRIIRYGAVVGVVLAALWALIDVSFAVNWYEVEPGVATSARVVSLIAPAVALVILRRYWPLVAAAPIVLVVPAAMASLPALFELPDWIVPSAATLAVAGLLWWAAAWPGRARIALLLGLLLPGTLLAFSVALSTLWVGLGLVGTLVGGAFVGPDGLRGAGGGVAVVLTAAIPLACRRWTMSPARSVILEVLGAFVVAMGAVMVAVGLVSATGWDGRVAVSLALLCASGVVIATRGLWRPARARVVTNQVCVAFVTFAGLLGVVEVGDSASGRMILPAVAAAVVPVIILVAARWTPRLTLGSAAMLTTALAAAATHASVVVHANIAPTGNAWLAGNVATLTVVAAAIVAAAIIWLLPWAPGPWRLPAAFGLIPAGAATLVLAALAGIAALPESVGLALGGDWPDLNQAGLAAAVVLGVAAVGGARLLATFEAALTNGRRGVDAAGASAALMAMVIGTAWARVELVPEWATFVGLGAAVTVGVATLVWSTGGARDVIRCGVGAWLTVQTLVAITALAFGDAPLWRAIIPAVVGAVILATVATRWLRITLAPAALVTALLVPAVVGAAGGSAGAVGFAATATLAALAWIARAIARRQSQATARPMVVGLVLPAGGVALAVGAAGLSAASAYDATLSGFDGHAPEWWSAGTALVAALGALAWGPARRRWTWVALVAVFVASGALSPLVGGIALIAFAGVLIALLVTDSWGFARTRRSNQWVALVATVISVGWAVGADWSVAVTTAIVAAVAWWIVVGEARVRRDGGVDGPVVDGAMTLPQWAPSNFVLGDLSIVIAVAYGAVFAAFIAASAGADTSFAAIVATAVAVASILLARLRGYESDERLGLALMGLATVIPIIFITALAEAGVVVLIASVGWWAMRLVGWRPGTWVAIGTTSVGVGLVLAGAGIGVAEAYFATPAVCALAIGAIELRANPAMRTFPALGPGLGLALIPSYLAMMVQPDVTWRVLILVVVTLALAVAGVMARWFAPVLAACVTAVVIALTQVLVTDDAAVRWVAFAVVGAFLLVIAATYEKLKKLR